MMYIIYSELLFQLSFDRGMEIDDVLFIHSKLLFRSNYYFSILIRVLDFMLSLLFNYILFLIPDQKFKKISKFEIS